MLVYCSLCVCNLFIRAGNRGHWRASVKLVTLPYLTLPNLTYIAERSDWTPFGGQGRQSKYILKERNSTRRQLTSTHSRLYGLLKPEWSKIEATGRQRAWSGSWGEDSNPPCHQLGVWGHCAHLQSAHHKEHK